MKIIMFISEDWHFYAHLLSIALKLQAQNHQVTVLSKFKSHEQKLIDKGLATIHINIDRANLNIIKEIKIIYKVIKIFMNEQPDIIHSFGLKPILYSSIYSIIATKTKIINTFLGMGFLFISQKIWVKFIRFVFVSLLRLCMLKKHVIFNVQNQSDYNLLKQNKIDQKKIYVQCAAGVNLNSFPLLELPKEIITFTLAARMIWDKGVTEFVEAAYIIKNNGLNAKFLLVGEPDHNNIRSISIEQLEAWHKEGTVKWLGYQHDMLAIWAKTHIAVLPSYREGVSRSILEAAACGRALIISDAPGCKDLITDNVEGIVVKTQNINSLAKAMIFLIENPSLIKSFGINANKLVKNKFTEEITVYNIISLYNKF